MPGTLPLPAVPLSLLSAALIHTPAAAPALLRVRGGQ
jgi:hypothetical protein